MKPFLTWLRVLRTFTGLAVGACASTAVAVPLMPMLNGTGNTAHIASLADIDGGAIMMGSIVVFVIGMPVGLIAHAVFYALKWRGFLTYALAGGVGGAMFGILTSLSGGLSVQTFLTSAFFGAWAAICAGVTWLIRRPDKDQKAEPKPETVF